MKIPIPNVKKVIPKPVKKWAKKRSKSKQIKKKRQEYLKPKPFDKDQNQRRQNYNEVQKRRRKKKKGMTAVDKVVVGTVGTGAGLAGIQQATKGGIDKDKDTWLYSDNMHLLSEFKKDNDNLDKTLLYGGVGTGTLGTLGLGDNYLKTRKYNTAKKTDKSIGKNTLKTQDIENQLKELNEEIRARRRSRPSVHKNANINKHQVQSSVDAVNKLIKQRNKLKNEGVESFVNLANATNLLGIGGTALGLYGLKKLSDNLVEGHKRKTKDGKTIFVKPFKRNN